jgi:lysophospholipase L1-like esterase
LARGRRRIEEVAVSRNRLIAVVAALLALTGAVTGCAASARPPAPPAMTSIGAMGDSITRAFDACTLLADCPAKSWATGSDPSIGSHYERLLARNPAMSGRVYNVAQVGASSADLAGQAKALAAARPSYVTMLIGANDACADTERAMTTPAVFRARVDAALSTIYAARPDTRMLVTSVPNLYRLWQVAHTNGVAQAVWSLGFCHTMLDRPTSTASTDEARRQRVLARIVDYNRQLAGACSAHPGCHYDGGAVFGQPFTIADLSPFDYFHPNAVGQRKLAAVTWAKTGF